MGLKAPPPNFRVWLIFDEKLGRQRLDGPDLELYRAWLLQEPEPFESFTQEF